MAEPAHRPAWTQMQLAAPANIACNRRLTVAVRLRAHAVNVARTVAMRDFGQKRSRNVLGRFWPSIETRPANRAAEVRPLPHSLRAEASSSALHAHRRESGLRAREPGCGAISAAVEGPREQPADAGV
jgi:hypothetical protein